MVNVIEDVSDSGTSWGISFTGSNPDAKDFFPMVDKETAFRMEKYLNELCLIRVVNAGQ